MEVKRYPFVDSSGLYELPGDVCTAEYVIDAADYDALEAEWMALSQDDGKVERALESAQTRIRELEAAEEGAKEAFGVVVDSKRELEARLASLQANYDALRQIYAEAKA